MSLPSRTACRSAKPAGWLMTNLVFLLCGRLKIAALKGVRAPRSTHLRFIPALESKHLPSSIKPDRSPSSSRCSEAALTLLRLQGGTTPTTSYLRRLLAYPARSLSTMTPLSVFALVLASCGTYEQPVL